MLGVGQVGGALEQRPAGVLEPACIVATRAVAQFVPVAAAHHIQRLVRQLTDVKRVETHDRVDVVMLADRLEVRSRHVGRDRLQLRRPRVSELVEEPGQRGRVAASSAHTIVPVSWSAISVR
jgi:hypothetical protein